MFRLCVVTGLLAFSASAQISLRPIGTFATGIFNNGACEISSYDPVSQRLFTINGGTRTVDVVGISDPTKPVLLVAIPIRPYGAIANSVAVRDGIVAVAVEANVKTNPGRVVFFDIDGRYVNAVTVGAEPDMLTFTPDGKKILVANEAEPNNSYTIDPEGSVSIIDVSKGAAGLTQAHVNTAGFNNSPALAAFPLCSSPDGAVVCRDASGRVTVDPGLRIFGPNATVAQDLEPEYIAVSADSKTAWVTLQENNAIAVLDIDSAQFTRIVSLGFKDHSKEGNGFDASDRDGKINIATWPVLGMYMPDAIASFRVGRATYLVTANEGDDRDYFGFSELARVAELPLDPRAFPNAAALKDDAALGRLRVTKANGDIDGDGDYDRLYSFGARSFSIWNADIELVYDSGDQFERLIAEANPANFNSNSTSNGTRDNRSPAKGPEPEGLTVAEVFGKIYVFIGLERQGGLMVYDLSDPRRPRFVQYVNNRNFSGDAARGTAGDLAPEGVLFIPAAQSPNGKPLVVTSNEVSGSTTIYEISETTPAL